MDNRLKHRQFLSKSVVSRSRKKREFVQTHTWNADKSFMSRSIDVAIRAAEQQSERELGSRIGMQMQASAKDVGQVDSFRHTILSYVASENYVRAVDELKNYTQVKKDYPQFKARASRYINYAIDLVNAIKAKRSFPGVQHLAMAKQQELYDRAMEHFEDLKATLKKIEQIDGEVRLEDVRSTVWVVKALIYCVFAILILAFLLEASRGVLPSVMILVDDMFGDLSNWLFDTLGL